MSSFHFGCDGSVYCSLYRPHSTHLHNLHVMSKQSYKCGSTDTDIINVYRNDTKVEYVCSFGIRTLDSMGRCSRSVVLTTSLKTVNRSLHFFQKCFMYSKSFANTLVLSFVTDTTQVSVNGAFVAHFFQRLHLQSNFVL